MTLWTVAVLRPPFAELTYAAPAGLEYQLAPGMRALVPLGRNTTCGVLLGRQEQAPAGVRIKELVWPLEREPLLHGTSLELARTLAERQLAPMGQALHFLLPPPLRKTAVRFVCKAEDLPGSLSAAEIGKLSAGERRRLALLWEQGRMEVRVAPPGPEEEVLALAADPPWPLRPGATRLAAVLDHVYDSGPVTRGALLRALGQGAAPAVRTLKQRGLLTVRAAEAGQCETGDLCPANGCGGLTATDSQQKAIDRLAVDLEQTLTGGRARASLLYGVTGSGKTLVYLELARQCLQAGRPVVLLAPEIALACSLAQAASQYLAQAMPEAEVLLTHGSQSPAERERTFRRASTASGPLVLVGTRSALLVPLEKPGLIVLDEEHDESYKQDERLSYQAKEVAWFLASKAGALIVLGSATPDIKTLHAADEGGLTRVDLTARVNDRPLPDVEMVDISPLAQGARAEDEDGGGTSEVLAPASLEALRNTLESGQQAIVMLNRRGYAPLMYCTACGETAKCPQCDVGYTLHKARQRLVCHYCGGSEPYPRPCVGCGATAFVPMGEGTERLTELVTEHLDVAAPEASVLRMDRDAARRPEVLERTIADFAAGKAQVLVGTQMLSKGHNFPGVTLVVVADGDLGLNLPEYRASERTFQLLTQVAGRAGRGDVPGKVLIQTRNPSHPIWSLVLARDYESFARRELDLRKRYGYPPFTKLGLVRISFPLEWEPGPALLGQLSDVLRDAAAKHGAMALGPAPAPLGLLRGRRRFNCLIKARDYSMMRAVYSSARAVAKPGGELRMALDYDPLSLL